MRYLKRGKILGVSLSLALSLTACESKLAIDKTKNQTMQDFHLFDAATDGKTYEIWITDATSDGTKLFLKNHALNKTPGQDWIVSNGKQKIFIARHIDENEEHEHEHNHNHEHEHEHEHSGEADEAEVFITDGTLTNTHKIEGVGENSFQKIASKFFVIDKNFYFLGFSDKNQYSIYKIENNSAKIISKNILKQLNIVNSSYEIIVINNRLYLFTMKTSENSIYNFNITTSSWQKIEDTQNFAVYPPLQIVELEQAAYILTKEIGLGANGSRLYKLDHQTRKFTIEDESLLPVGISKCFVNSACGFSLKVENSKKTGILRIFTPNQQTQIQPLKIDDKAFELSQIKSVHFIKDSLYILQEESKVPTPLYEKSRNLYKIEASGAMQKVKTDFDISDIANAHKNTNPIQKHTNLNSFGFLFISDKKQADKEFSCFEPWVLDIEKLQARKLAEIFPKQNASKTREDACYSSFTQATNPILLNGKILFVANSGDKGANATGRELYISDTKTISLLKDIAKGTSNGVYEDAPHSHGGHQH